VDDLALDGALHVGDFLRPLVDQDDHEVALGVVLGDRVRDRLQILLLELAGSTLLLLDEPTDNLDLASAEALQQGLDSYAGTVLAVTHDRWFARSFDRYLVFGADGAVYEPPGPVWDETRVQRPR
jgi:ATPase subunit of ABC transporter with duplicated ATPase domains